MELTSEKSCCSAGNNQVDEQAGITQHREVTSRWWAMKGGRVWQAHLGASCAAPAAGEAMGEQQSHSASHPGDGHVSDEPTATAAELLHST